MNLAELLKLKYPEADFTKDILLADYGKGPVIQKWNLTGVPKPSKSQLSRFKAELQAEHDAQRIEERRRAEYEKQGADLHNLVIALWEKIMEQDSIAADVLQIKRQQVKQEIPE